MDMLTSKRESPKFKNSIRRRTVKLSLLSVARITPFKKKLESFGHWVEIAVYDRYLKEEEEARNRKILMITENYLFIQNKKLSDDLTYYKKRLDKVEESYSKSMRELQKFKLSL